MPAPAPSIDRVQLMLATLRRTDLLEPDLLAAVEALPAAAGSDANRLARDLLRRELFTKHQLTQLARGADSQLRLGGYTLLEPIGDGPAGPIYRAKHRATGREVRLHRVTAADKEKLAALHAAIDRVLDAGSFDGGYFVVEPAGDEPPARVLPEKRPSRSRVWIAASVFALSVTIGLTTWAVTRENRPTDIPANLPALAHAEPSRALADEPQALQPPAEVPEPKPLPKADVPDVAAPPPAEPPAPPAAVEKPPEDKKEDVPPGKPLVRRSLLPDDVPPDQLPRIELAPPIVSPAVPFPATIAPAFKKFGGEPGSEVAGLAVVKDGAELLSVHSSGFLRVWDVKTAQQLREVGTGRRIHGGGGRLRVSPDGEYVAVSGIRRVDDLSVVPGFATDLDDAEDGGPIAFHPGGRYVLWGTGNRAHLRDLRDGEIVRTYAFDRTVKVFYAGFDGTGRMVTARDESSAFTPAKDVDTERRADAPDAGIPQWTSPLTLGADNRAYVSFGHNSSAFRSPDRNGGRPVLYTLPMAERYQGRHIEIEGMWSVTASRQHIALMSADGRCFQVPMPLGTELSTLAVAPGGMTFFVGTSVGDILRLDLNGGPTTYQPGRLFDSLTSSPRGPVRRRKVAAVMRAVPALGPVAAGGQLPKWTGPAAFTLAFSANGQKLVTGDTDRTLRAFDVATGKAGRSVTDCVAAPPDLATADTQCALVAMNNDGSIALTTGNKTGGVAGVSRPDTLLRSWNLSTGKETRLGTHVEAFTFVAVSEAGGRAVTGALDQQALAWDVRAARPPQRLERDHLTPLRTGDISPNQQRAVGADEDGKIVVWNLNGRGRLAEFKSPFGLPRSVAFSPDGKLLLVVDERVSVFDAETFKFKCVVEPPPAMPTVAAACWAGPRGAVALAGCGGIMIVQPETGKILHHLSGATADIKAVAGTGNGRYVAAVGSSLWVWELDKPAVDAVPKNP